MSSEWLKYCARTLAPYVPTPQAVVDRSLGMAGLRKSDVFYDLGCGDARVVMAAANKVRGRLASRESSVSSVTVLLAHAGSSQGVARAVGVELEEETMKLARANIAKLRPELASKVWPAELRARAQLCLARAFSSCACPPAVPC